MVVRASVTTTANSDAAFIIDAMSELVLRLVKGNKADMSKNHWKSNTQRRNVSESPPYAEGMERLASYCRSRSPYYPILHFAFQKALVEAYPLGINRTTQWDIKLKMPDDLRYVSSDRPIRSAKASADLAEALSRLSSSRRREVVGALHAEILSIEAMLESHRKTAPSRRTEEPTEVHDEPMRNDTRGHSAPAPRPPASFR